MSHHYGEYWSNWSDEHQKEKKPLLLEEIKTFLLTLHDSEKAAELIERIEKEAREWNKI
jgi:hypothetical protein